MEKITLTGAKETLLIPLYCRATDSKSAAPILNDPYAADVLSKLDYDINKLAISDRSVFLSAARAKQFDQMVRDFIAKHPTATVVHLACGLDSRAFRIDPPPTLHWVDLDYPDVIALRERLYPPRDNYTMLGASVDDENWLEAIPANQPTLIAAEGLTMYLSEGSVMRLFERITSHFRSGELLFDAYSARGASMSRQDASIRATGAEIGWSIEDPLALEQRFSRLKFVRKWSFIEAPAIKTLPLGQRLLYGVIGSLPGMAQAHRVLLYAF